MNRNFKNTYKILKWKSGLKIVLNYIKQIQIQKSTNISENYAIPRFNLKFKNQGDKKEK